MNLKEYLSLTLKIVEKEAEIELIKKYIDESNSICFEYEDEIKKIIINYIKDYLSRMGEKKINFTNINDIIYFNINIPYTTYDILNNFFEVKIKENGVSDKRIIENAIQLLVKKYLEYKIEENIFISYNADKLYFTDIKRFFNLFEVNVNKISLNNLVDAYNENKKFNNLFEEQNIMKLHELMVFK